MPTDLPEPKPDLPPARSGRTVVLMIVGWTVVLLILGAYGVKKLKSDPCWDHGPGAPPPPAECAQLLK